MTDVTTERGSTGHPAGAPAGVDTAHPGTDRGQIDDPQTSRSATRHSVRGLRKGRARPNPARPNRARRTATRPNPARPRGWRHWPFFRNRSWIPWLFLIVPLIFATVFKFVPMIEGVRMSLFKVQPFLGDIWVGLDNYVNVLTDPRFMSALWHTLVIGIASTLISLVIGFALALLLEGEARKLRITRTLVFLPVVTAVAVVAEIWRIMYFPTDTGFLNSILTFFHLPTSQFLNSPSTALLCVIVVIVWMQAPYNMVIILAGLTGIDRTLYEAGAVDGVTIRQRLRYITMPALRPAISIVLTLAAIRSLRVFTEVYTLTGGGPAGSTEVWMTRVYSLGFDQNNLGVASAASTLLLVATLLLTVGVQLYTRRKQPS